MAVRDEPDSLKKILPQYNLAVQSTVSAQPAYQKEEIEARMKSVLSKLDATQWKNYLNGIKLV